MNNKISVAIDGPSSAGKSTVSKILAKKLGYIYLDTGAMYRAVTLAAIRSGVDLDNDDLVSDIAKKQEITFRKLQDGQHVYLNEEDVTGEIRDHLVTNTVSKIASIDAVRKLLVAKQQLIGADGGIVMDGRDIGTAVLPKAEVKIFLVASVEERAERRYKENIEKGIETDFDELKADIERRDRIDSTREISPLTQAEDAILLDTTGMDIMMVVSQIEEIIKEKI